MNKRRQDKIYFRKSPERKHNRMPMPTNSNAAKTNFSRRTCLFLSWITIVLGKRLSIFLFIVGFVFCSKFAI